MPKEITPAVFAHTLRTSGVAFAYEERGDPPAPQLVMIHSYELLDQAGNVVGTKSVGMDAPDILLNTIEQLITDQTAVATAAEAL